MIPHIDRNVFTFTPVETEKQYLSSLPARYLSPFFCDTQIAVLIAGQEKDCTSKREAPSFAMTALKIATYILSAGIFPLLAVLLNLVIRCGTDYRYIDTTQEVTAPPPYVDDSQEAIELNTGSYKSEDMEEVQKIPAAADAFEKRMNAAPKGLVSLLNPGVIETAHPVPVRREDSLSLHDALYCEGAARGKEIEKKAPLKASICSLEGRAFLKDWQDPCSTRSFNQYKNRESALNKAITDRKGSLVTVTVEDVMNAYLVVGDD